LKKSGIFLPHFYNIKENYNNVVPVLWTGTTIELAAALKVGYVVTKVFSALVYEQFSDEIFKGYVGDFMAMKIHASGFDKDMDTEEKQKQYILECDKFFNIKINKEKMFPNAAKRTLAKLANNSLWGKFAEGENLSKTVITNNPAILRKFLDNRRLEVSSVDLLNDDVIMLTYKSHKDFVQSGKTNNVAIAAWTTSLARLRLLDALQAVVTRENEKGKSAVVLYWDTDSILYAIREGFDDPLAFLENPHLGGLKDEKPGMEILEYCSGGPKNYALKMRNNKTNELLYEMKIRGLTLDFATCQKLQYETFRRKILNFGNDDEPLLSVHYEGVLRPDDKTGNVYTTPMTKIFRPVIRKGIVDDEYQIRDFGHKNT
jgi:hypothetical protein